MERARIFLVLLLAGLAGAADQTPAPPGFKPAYPPSPLLLGLKFHDTTERKLAPGSDIWPITWAADDHLYTAFGDGGGFAVSNNPVFKRYLLTTIHRVREEGWMAVYDAPEPWGPWTLVHCERNPERWGSAVRGPILFTFVNKWLSADGTRFVIVHTKDDSWATIEGRFVVAENR